MVTTRSGKPTQREPAKKKQKLDTKDSDFKHDKKTGSKETPSAAKTKSPKKSAARLANADRLSSKILEKGIMYYFIRGRVEIDTPKSIDEIARGYLILRPLPEGEKLHGTLPTTATSRVIALPKKGLPARPKDRFMAFVEKADSSYDKLRETFLEGAEHETKTAGHRHSPDATPVGEGVYVLTTTGRESHLSYTATLPDTLGDLQHVLNFNRKGSFIISSKNPQYKRPEDARLPQGPDYPSK
jgi:hypothetical protein